MKLLALLWMLLLATNPGAAPSAPPAHPTARPSPAASISPDALFSRRALRRARLLIQMRMLQFRNERLDCVRAALLRQLPPGPTAPRAHHQEFRRLGRLFARTLTPSATFFR